MDPGFAYESPIGDVTNKFLATKECRLFLFRRGYQVASGRRLVKEEAHKDSKWDTQAAGFRASNRYQPELDHGDKKWERFHRKRNEEADQRSILDTRIGD